MVEDQAHQSTLLDYYHVTAESAAQIQSYKSCDPFQHLYKYKEMANQYIPKTSIVQQRENISEAMGTLQKDCQPSPRSADPVDQGYETLFDKRYKSNHFHGPGGWIADFSAGKQALMSWNQEDIEDVLASHTEELTNEDLQQLTENSPVVDEDNGEEPQRTQAPERKAEAFNMMQQGLKPGHTSDDLLMQ
ncbi:hypothetical protein Hamer_G000144 [Homarus americanus]|uniref:Uncharacterized protein n=1 Tax=Homarus americanus TaxID=6706 RepID=A0A8J5NCK2_HOMAM|nr:hypothetical protein Hamer_G000144 [Homarus americanus]